ncbi:mediator of RNA polymerase II transcription subunit 15 [Drosophila busckii]|uniref:mediator of RNA polymerase II transcription subunit 15 n=1 Tax=Drosophila busckii TaxID=30019 RepID=UPI00083EAFC4|nr:mediator of RNA polymerase II transcription subunit 15 [Drosophila busckii]
MAHRKDDPVFNVKFVQLVEQQPCLWNYTHPGYSKKEEVIRAWQDVANDMKDTVRNSRERWRTIRSSFLRSMKLGRTQTGRGKRKYYLSKYLQFLLPYTKARAHLYKHQQQQQQQQQSPQQQPQTLSAQAQALAQLQANPIGGGGMVLRKLSSATFVPMNRSLGQLRVIQQQQQTHQQRQSQQQQQPILEDISSDSQDSEEMQPKQLQTECVCVDAEAQQPPPQAPPPPPPQPPQQPPPTHQPSIRCRPLATIKAEQPQPLPQPPPQITREQQQQIQSCITLPASMNWHDLADWIRQNNNNVSTNSMCATYTPWNPPTNHLMQNQVSSTTPPLPPTPASMQTDANFLFLISLHPYLSEMTGKQNRRFRQKVVRLIDDILDNVDSTTRD